MPQIFRLNYYGFCGLTVAVLSIASLLVLTHKQCWIDIRDYDKLAIIQIVGAVYGSVIYSYSNTTATHYNTRTYASVVLITIIVGGLMFLSAYTAFTHPCIDGLDFVRLWSKTHKNAFTAGDLHNIVIMVLDSIAGLALFSVGCTLALRF